MATRRAWTTPEVTRHLAWHLKWRRLRQMAYNAVYSITIRAPQQEVFDYVADVSRHGEWGSADDHMKASAEAPGTPTAGARYKAEGMLNGKPNESVVTMTTLEPPKRLAFAPEDSNPLLIPE